MDLFWKRINATVLEKTGITESQYFKALGEQKDTIVELLSFHCYPENAIEAEIKDIKEQILKLYTDVIAPVISKIEVYSHDLDESVVEAVFNLLQQITSAELESDLVEKQECYKKTLAYVYFIKHTIHISLAELYFDRIRTYKKTIKDFNHCGVYKDGKPFDKVVREKFKLAKKQYRASKRLYKPYVKKGKENVAYIRLANVQEDIGLDNLIFLLENIVDMYMNTFPEIINNGYNMSLGYRLVSRTLEIVSTFLLIYGFLKYANLWQNVINWFINLIK